MTSAMAMLLSVVDGLGDREKIGSRGCSRSTRTAEADHLVVAPPTNGRRRDAYDGVNGGGSRGEEWLDAVDSRHPGAIPATAR